jgi:hypothetical protein
MTSPKMVILYYSLYSEDCKRFIDTMKKFNIDYVTPVCIDNISVRQAVKPTIKFVPAIMFVYDDSTIENYQGDKAMMWLDSIIRPIQEQLEREERERIYQQQMMHQQMMQQPQEREQEVVEVRRPKKSSRVEPEESEEEEEEPRPKKKSGKLKTTPLDASGMGLSSKEKDKKRGDLLARAAELTKSRELEMEKEDKHRRAPEITEKKKKKKRDDD